MEAQEINIEMASLIGLSDFGTSSCGLPDYLHPIYNCRAIVPQCHGSRSDAVKAVIYWCGKDVQRRVDFMNSLHSVCASKPGILKNKAGNAVVSDFDKFAAEPAEICEALLKAAGKWR